MDDGKLTENSSMIMLNEGEVEQVGGALAPLLVWGLWTGGGALLGLGAAAAVHYWGNGKHNH